MPNNSFLSAVTSRLPHPRRMLAVGLAASLLIGGGVVVNNYFGKNNAAPLNTVTVTQGDIEKSVTSLGKLKPKDYVDVGTQVSGQLKKIHVQIGERVKKGDLIAEIDPTVYAIKIRTDQANLESLQAQLNQQQAEAALASQQFERNQDLLKEHAISQETVEGNQSALKVADAKVAATRAQIKASQATLDGDVANLGYTKIHAPMDGTVVSQTTLQGQTVNANQAAPVIVRVADLDTMTVWAQVAEADITKLKAGMPAYFSTLGSEKRWQGKVRQVMPTPETVNDVVLYNVLVDVDNREQVLMSDMTVQVFFVLDAARNATMVPLAALRQVPGKDTSRYKATVVTVGGVVEKTVTIGIANRTMAAVTAGLDVGDIIVSGRGKDSDSSTKSRSQGMPPGAGPRL